MAAFLGSKTFSFCKERFTPQRVRARRTALHCPHFCQLLTFTLHASSWRGTQPQRWFICSEPYPAPSPPCQAVWGCSLEPSWVICHQLLPTTSLLPYPLPECYTTLQEPAVPFANTICWTSWAKITSSQTHTISIRVSKPANKGSQSEKKGPKNLKLLFLFPASFLSPSSAQTSSLTCSNCSGWKRKFQFFWNFWLLF